MLSLLETLGENPLSCLFQHADVAFIPWLPSSVLKANNVGSSPPVSIVLTLFCLLLRTLWLYRAYLPGYSNINPE